jgi:hypothetical protein
MLLSDDDERVPRTKLLTAGGPNKCRIPIVIQQEVCILWWACVCAGADPAYLRVQRLPGERGWSRCRIAWSCSNAWAFQVSPLSTFSSRRPRACLGLTDSVPRSWSFESIQVTDYVLGQKCAMGPPTENKQWHTVYKVWLFMSVLGALFVCAFPHCRCVVSFAVLSGPDEQLLDQDAGAGTTHPVPHALAFPVPSSNVVLCAQGLYLFRACAINNVGVGEFSDDLQVVSNTPRAPPSGFNRNTSLSL